MKKLALLLCLCSFTLMLSAQHRFGVRAGINYSRFSGELEINESYSFASGFHFGFNYTYQFTPVIGLRAELLYLQKGTKRDFEDDNAFNVVIPISTPRFVEEGKVDFFINYSHTYFSIPITAMIQVTPKLELFGGVSVDMMFGPAGAGTMYFESIDRPDQIRYEIQYDHNYKKDQAGGLPNALFSNPQFTSLIINGEAEDIVRIRGAYFDNTAAELQQLGKKFNFWNSSVILGFNVFVNRGFYIGLRGELGLTDVTNDRMDFSLKELDGENNLIPRADRDITQNLSLSFGFRF